ncbi:MAG: PTS sugar transporter subunit IIB, partial [Eggerthellaceae bacterium]|nr:PTS sugar transporter subunit IIB [Eggerthellaceae bacterium]
MLVIRLFCAAGMSTSLLVRKMEEAAKAEGTEVDIVAYPV